MPRTRSAPDLSGDLTPDSTLVVPRVRHVRDVERLLAVAKGDDAFVHEPLVGELVVVYAFDRPDIYQFVSRRDLRALGLSMDALRSLALDNAVRIAGGGFLVEAIGPMLGLSHDLATVTLLIPGFFEKLEAELGSAVVVGVPTRDKIIACRLDDVATVGLLAAILADDQAPEGPALCPDLLVRVNGAWERLEDGEDGEDDDDDDE